MTLKSGLEVTQLH